MKTTRLTFSKTDLIPNRVFSFLSAATLLATPLITTAGAEPGATAREAFPSHQESSLNEAPPLHILLAAWERDDDDRDRERDRSDDRRDDHRDDRRGDTEEDSRNDDRRGRAEGTDEMAMLDRLLAMPPEQLSRIRAAVERIEAMSPEEREALRERLRDFHEISPEQRQSMRKKWRELSPEQRRDFIHKMRERRWEEVFKEEGETASEPSEKTDETQDAPAEDNPAPDKESD